MSAAARLPEVAKLLATISRDGADLVLLSRKRASAKSKHGRLELLGGHVEPGEAPLDALVRELAEEERTGALAGRVRTARPRGRIVRLRTALYHVFPITLSPEEVAVLRPGEHESLGFQLVARAELGKKRVREQLTEKTRELFRRLEP
jgi:8-oxo-dGTP pyrophosphatase MutT (NUDIX family)